MGSNSTFLDRDWKGKNRGDHDGRAVSKTRHVHDQSIKKPRILLKLDDRGFFATRNLHQGLLRAHARVGIAALETTRHERPGCSR
jgi:hypothetical protein